MREAVSTPFDHYFRTAFAAVPWARGFARIWAYGGLLGIFLGRSWAVLGALGRSWVLLGVCWAVLGGSWALLGPLLGRSWAALGGPGRFPGSLLAALGRQDGQNGPQEAPKRPKLDETMVLSISAQNGPRRGPGGAKWRLRGANQNKARSGRGAAQEPPKNHPRATQEPLRTAKSHPKPPRTSREAPRRPRGPKEAPRRLSPAWKKHGKR